MKSSDRGVLTNAAATVLGRAIGQLFRFFAMLLAAAHLGPEGWGAFGVLVTSLDLVRALTSFGLDTASVRWMAIHPASAARLQRGVLVVKTVLSGVAFAGVVAFVALRPAAVQSPWLLVLLACALFPQAWSATLVARFQATHTMHRLIPMQVLVGVLYLAAVVVAIALGVGVPGFVGLAIGYEAVVFLATLVIARRTTFEVVAQSTETIAMSRFILEGLPLGIMELVVVAYARIGVLILEHFSDLSAVGRLYAAIRINDQTIAIAGAVAASALPVLARLAHEGRTPLVMRSFVRWSMGGAAISVSAAIVLTFGGATLLGLVKPAYVAAAPVLAVLSWAGVAMFQNNLSAAVLFALGRFRITAAVSIWNLFVYVALAWTLVPRLGAMGAVLATLITEATSGVFYLALIAVLLRRARRPDVAPTTGPAAAS